MSYLISEPEPAACRDEVLRLWNRNLPEGSDQRYDWLYGRGRCRNWLVQSDDRSVVGANGLMHRELQIGDDLVPAGQSVDLNIDRRHRTILAALTLQRAVTETVQSGRLGLIYALPNPQAETVLRRIGYRLVGPVTRWAKPLRAGRWLPPWIGPAAARKVLARGLDPLLFLCSREPFGRRPAGWHAEVMDRFDARFDLLWEQARSRFGVIGRRTAAFLNWRFAQTPGGPYRVFCLADRHDRLLAYLVFSVRQGTAYLADFLFLESRQLRWLLREFLRYARCQDCHGVVVEFFGSAAVTRTFSRFGFWSRPSPWNLLVFAGDRLGSRQREQVFCPQAWFFTRADVDTDFA